MVPIITAIHSCLYIIARYMPKRVLSVIFLLNRRITGKKTVRHNNAAAHPARCCQLRMLVLIVFSFLPTAPD